MNDSRQNTGSGSDQDFRRDLQRLVSETMRGSVDAITNGVRVAQALAKAQTRSSSPADTASRFTRLSADAAGIINRHSRAALAEILSIIDADPDDRAKSSVVQLSALPGTTARGAFILANTSQRPFSARFVMSDFSTPGYAGFSGIDSVFSPPSVTLNVGAETQVLVEIPLSGSAPQGVTFHGVISLAGQPDVEVHVQLSVIQAPDGTDPVHSQDSGRPRRKTPRTANRKRQARKGKKS